MSTLLKLKSTLDRAINGVTKYLESNPKDEMAKARLANLKAELADGRYRLR